MSVTIGDITDVIERFAPPALQEDYDNSGLIIGDRHTPCSGVLAAFDVTPTTVDEAVATGCNLIVAHHPLIFRGLRRLNGSNAVERTVIAAVRAGVAVYAAHTSADNVRGGVSWRMASMLGLKDVEVLDAAEGKVEKLVTYVPSGSLEIVREALFAAGAGHIGKYDSCCFHTSGTGTFRALDGARPYAGAPGEFHREKEERLEVILPAWRHRAVEHALTKAHPYEEPAYDFYAVRSGADRQAGAGVVGNLEEPVTVGRFVALVKEAFGCRTVRCSDYPADRRIARVALCGGSGAFLTGKAMAAGAQAFVTADVKYHDFADAADEIFLVDAGHFETEHCITSLFREIITDFFPNFAVRCATTLRNPVNYM